jgi:hypothetical protein
MDNLKDAITIVRAYHGGWTSKNFDAAIDLLSPDLQVEVPINSYPSKDSFAQAVKMFGGFVKSVTLLAEFAQGDEAMLLYDMDVTGLGKMRIAEHFTVANGRITRIRQVHDTAALRTTGFARST